MAQNCDGGSEISPDSAAERTETLLTEIQTLIEGLKSPDLDAEQYQNMVERAAHLSIEATQFMMCRLRTSVRLHFRYPVRVLGTDVLGMPFTAETFTEDLSRGGACVLLEQEVKQGNPLVLFSKDTPERGAVASIVRWTSKADLRWRVGVKFLSPLYDPLTNLSPVEALKPGVKSPTVEVPIEQSKDKKTETKPVEATLLKTGFVHLLVHDLKGPLAAIQGVLETIALELDGRGINDQLISDLIAAGVDSCQTILRLVTDLLDVAKFDSQAFAVRLSPINVCDIVRAAVAEVHTLAVQKQITINEKFPQDLPIIMADNKLVARALVNLLNNAVKFTDCGGRVDIEARVVEGRRVDAGRNFLVLSVTDTGEGMPPEDVPYAFDLYWQSASGKARGGGSGLGLAMVKRIAAAHGGNVSVRSQVGVGSTFAVVLPV